MGLKITSPGLLTTVQDLGRFGLMAKGFSQSGAMDADAFLTANRLLSNNDSEGALEMTLMGISGEFTEDCVIAVTGADMGWLINDKELIRYKATEVKKGDKLKSSAARNGMRAYLAVAGGFDIPFVLGSYSTNLKCGIGGFHGRKLQSGDELPFRFERGQLLAKYKGAAEIPKYDDEEINVRVVLGPQDDYFTEDGKKTFLSSPYTVTMESDRMGIRLDGEKVEASDGVDIISDGIALGSVQIPSSGKPIIMMADRQTTGGYAKIATVISTDIPKLAQAKPGAKLYFKAVSPAEAQKIYKKHKRELAWLEYRLLF